MIRRYFYKICSLFLFLPFAAMATEHVAWQLDGAQERIEIYRKGECELKLLLPDGKPVPMGTHIQLEQTRHAFQFGGALAQTYLLHKHPSYADYKKNFARLFNYATTGFYWIQHERKPNSWQLQSYTEEAMNWALKHGMTLRGHPLMWHNSAPRWITDAQRDVQDLDRDIMSHVRMLVKTYPQIDQWDLYNETPGFRLMDPEQGVRRWVESWGGAGPVTKRLVDEVLTIRPDGFYSLNHFKHNDPQYHQQIQYCLDNQVRFDAIGIQSHMHMKDELWSEDQMWATLERYRKYQKPIHLSEISVVSCELFNNWRELQAWEEEIKAARRARKTLPFKTSTKEGEQYQAAYVHDFYTLAFSHPSVDAIIWWSVSDQGAWRGMPSGLVDLNGNPKPVYKVLDRLINQEWRTNTKARVKSKGQVKLRGFLGTYQVYLKLDTKIMTTSFDLKRNQQEVLQLVLHEGS